VSHGDLDTRVRLHLYESFVADGRPPTVAETAAALEVREPDAAAAYRRLEENRVIVLAPGTLNVWMVNPLSATPTPFRVETPRGSYWANCIWDALGIPAMLGTDGTVATSCPDCGEAMELRVDEDGPAGDAIVHFAVPARRWWDNIAFT
jgi:hypothetical protein